MHETRATALRAALTATREFQGITGVLSCDPFGDYGTGASTSIDHCDRRTTDAAQAPRPRWCTGFLPERRARVSADAQVVEQALAQVLHRAR